MEYWRQSKIFKKLHHIPIALLLLFSTLRGTFCSAEITTSNKNEQTKTSLQPTDSVTIGDTSVKKIIDVTEGSGKSSNIEWSDDEDLAAEGSGGQIEGSGDIEQDYEHIIAPIITSEEVPRIKIIDRISTTTTHREPLLETKVPTRPPVIAKPPEVGSTNRSTLSILTAFIIILWAPLLLH